MIRRKILLSGIFLTLFGCLPFSVFAEHSLKFGDYIVHFNAFRSDSLTPDIAKAYQLTRRNNRMVVNITVQKQTPEGKTQPVKANVTGFASNLTGQVKNLEFREIHDGDAIYYLAQSQISNRETLKFDIKAVPEGETISANVKFKQQFFTD
ncbi:MAG: DUF4426 domain-containing protein [Gammaproteobacteria bacterium]|nr:DUF4426 domain-containing protein [Gammaproteobacteria bacterium]MCW9005949.1 DUF4426 domain-containing protein [Gammaproteobacteria bacterium]MCW9056384.1 DUF4426 domain-containing protein [Gammaproteobacteria bacterium]